MGRRDGSDVRPTDGGYTQRGVRGSNTKIPPLTTEVIHKEHEVTERSIRPAESAMGRSPYHPQTRGRRSDLSWVFPRVPFLSFSLETTPQLTPRPQLPWLG